ncbi:hypothetical protein C2E25_07780 [Geothermobacter hydrogeniphilus]|uniref:Smr domain-containing protein n=1 Tax=Geothermobacter hydrogeniphilus TaxID=1969733 RepID=A0A2K2HAH0_9BACT|nr:Smr/MutS family protein [Geothermobacter hydrogeniphilus]PNU20315.1 hypothetical protein C2E25_07780 [Geothermobacter hydrogeniphilus]
MASRKSKKDFNNSPFKKLKGLSVPSPAKTPAALLKPAPPEAAEAEEDFASAMESLGVTRFSDDEDRSHRSVEPVEDPPVTVPRSPASDEDEFLAALGQLDVRFTDERPEEEEPAAVPRRMKQLQRGRLRVERDLDLHGLSRARAEEAFRHFLVDARYQGWTTVRVITGRGLHSPDGPVLRDAIEQLLKRESFPEVVEWGRAPHNQGGQGALILFLRTPPSP